MDIRTLLAIFHSEGDAPRLLDFALPFASRHQSHLIGLHAEALPVVLATPMEGPFLAVTNDMEHEAAERHARLRDMVEERARVEGVSLEWRGFDSISGDSAVSGIDSARSADLVVVLQNDPKGIAAADLETLLFHSGRPVLFVPHAYTRNGATFQKVVIAWNGSKESARAAFDALPLLKEAGSVEILTIDAPDGGGSGGKDGTAIATALARHGLDVTIMARQSGKMAEADILNAAIMESGADLLVMGAFGRSRLAEFVFGGMTRSVLQSITVPTLMSR
ncbi:universal stress protein [Nitratireductor aestuarii]|uniref:Universal stress protein n=1 Tax=Nitratireductor aestuarii TaxID=1735103 RepID=A0A916RHJ1_9HYPH|nr:universal stress protein [Nitratireductor aestuarii]GGA54525.1 universal stress protein [Nitratireductor aestuarii]